MNRGSLDTNTSQITTTTASMRPRFMNRGSGLGPMVVRGLDVASMRPRFMNRGSSDSQAGIPCERAASMRPRFMNRGSAG